LHGGKAPRWLFHRMTKLAGAISDLIVYEYGQQELLRRISDPFWFQAFSCVLGFDWHSSGTTTVTCGALKEALKSCQLGIGAAGGKGAVSRRAPEEIEAFGEINGLSDGRIRKLVRASKLAAKVDSAAIQDQHQLYHHLFVLTEKGDWAVVQQGLHTEAKFARRYHWLGENVETFTLHPHEVILGNLTGATLDMTAKESVEAQKVSVDLVNDGPSHLRSMIRDDTSSLQLTLEEFDRSGHRGASSVQHHIQGLHMPWNVNWKTLDRAYNIQPANYEELLQVKGVGPATIRALAYISEVAYGTSPSWRDPVKYSFAVGGKDGVPYPVNRRAMDRSIEILKDGVAQAKMGKQEKLGAIRRLRRFVPPDVNV